MYVDITKDGTDKKELNSGVALAVRNPLSTLAEGRARRPMAPPRPPPCSHWQPAGCCGCFGKTGGQEYAH